MLIVGKSNTGNKLPKVRAKLIPDFQTKQMFLPPFPKMKYIYM